MVKKSELFSLLNDLIYKQTLNNLKLSQFQAEVKVLSTFSQGADFKLPLMIQGRLISSGTYNDLANGNITILPEDLKPTLANWKGVKIFKSHGAYQAINSGKDVSVDNVVGLISNALWDSNDEGVNFTAEIYDQDVAFKIMNGLIKFISVGFHRDIVPTKTGVNLVKNIEPAEASLVFRPRDEKAEFHVAQG